MIIDETEMPGDEILSALKEDGRVAAPTIARARVLARLGVGVTAGAIAASHAAAASAVVGKAAGTSAAPVAGGVLGAGLAKAVVTNPVVGFFAMLTVGSGVGLGAYQAFQPDRAPVVATAKQGVEQAKPMEITPQPKAARAAPAVPEVPVEPVVPAPPAHVAPAPAARPATASSPPPSALTPAPDLPADPGNARLAEQQTLLDEARASLRRGDGAGALAIVTGHEKRYPATAFTEEREAIGVLALVMSGRTDEARARGEAFERRFPSSLFLPSIRKALAPHGSAPNEADLSE